MYSRDHRYTVLHSVRTNVWTLEIRGVQGSEQGQYQCQAPTSAGVRTNSYSLMVRQPVVIILGSSEKHVSLGDSITMTCELRDSEVMPDHLSWYHNSEIIENPPGVLVTSTMNKSPAINVYDNNTKTLLSKLKIWKTKLKDSGNYSCASSSISSEDITLFVSAGM